MLKLVQPGTTTASGMEITAAGVVVGRERGCDLMLCSKGVSRKHARLILRDNTVYVEDLGSINGTLIDGHAIKWMTELLPGHSVTFGDLTFLLIEEKTNQDGSSPVSPADLSPVVSPKTSPVATLKTSDATEAKSVRQFAIRRKETARNTSSQAEPQTIVNKVVPTDSPNCSPDRDGKYVREACVLLLVLVLLSGFGIGRSARGLGGISVPGERDAMQNLITPDTNVADSQPPLDESGTDANGQSRPEPSKSDHPSALTDVKTPNRLARSSSDSQGKNPTQKDPVDLPTSENSGEMSISDSAKAVKLMKEIQRLKVDMRNEEAVLKVAQEQLALPREQAKRVVKFVTVMAERKAIMEGGLDAIAKLESKPRSSAPTETTPPTRVSDSASSLSDPASPVGGSVSPSPQTSTENTKGNTKADAQPRNTVIENIQGTGTSVQPQVQSIPVERGPGYYFNLWGLAVIVGLLLVWMFAVDWMGRDAGNIGSEAPKWFEIYTLAGPAGAFATFLCPDLAWGVLLNSALIGAPLLAYLADRDQRVPRTSRVLRFINWLDPQPMDNVGSESVEQGVEFLNCDADNGRSVALLAPHEKRTPGVLAAKSLVASAIARRASDILLEPDGNQFVARLRIDGLIRPGPSYPDETGRALTNVFKKVALIGSSGGRREQDGKFRVKLAEEILNVRVVSQGTPRGETLSLRLLREQEELTNISGLGCHRKIQGELRDLIAQPHGLFLVCGPTGSGKSTTLRSIVSEIDPATVRIITIESPIEYRMPGVIQNEINTLTGQTFSSALSHVLRQDSDVILVGEIRDLETANAACQAANSEHLVLAAVPANDALSAIRRLIDLGADPLALSNALLAVLGQRLIRRLCPICKVEFRPDGELLRRYRIPSDRDRVLYRPPPGESKCEACEGVGYRGRTGIFELLTMDGAIRTLIRDRAPQTDIKDAARRHGMTTIRESGFLQALRGVTSLDEVDAATTNERT